jgi:hypothetical protein
VNSQYNVDVVVALPGVVLGPVEKLRARAKEEKRSKTRTRKKTLAKTAIFRTQSHPFLSYKEKSLFIKVLFKAQSSFINKILYSKTYYHKIGF